MWYVNPVRASLTAAALTVLCAVGLSTSSSVATSSSVGGTQAPAKPFGRSWAAPLPAQVRIQPDSARVVANFVKQYKRYYGSVGVNNGRYGVSIALARRNQPPVPITISSGCGNFVADTGRYIPIPPSARPASGTDGSLIVSQPSRDREWELWQARRNPNGSWSACWGGRLTHLRTSSGVFPFPYGLSASGISYLGTTITFANIQSHSIDHVMALSVVRCNGSVPPADRGDCGSDPGEPSEGTWFRLPPSLAMPKGLTPFAQLVFKALQRYGAIVTDQAGDVSIGTQTSADWARQGHRGIDPITSSFAGKKKYEALQGIPWSKLQVIYPPQRAQPRRQGG